MPLSLDAIAHFLWVAMQKIWLILTLISTPLLSDTLWVVASAQAPMQPSFVPPERIAQTNCGGSNPPYRCITPAIFRCLKRNNTGGGGSLEYRGGNSGEIVVKGSGIGAVALLGFRFDESTQTLDLNMKKKFFPVPDQRVWDGFKDTLAKCRQNPNR